MWIVFKCFRVKRRSHEAFTYCESVISDLSNMYRLLSPISDGLGVLVQEVEEHIKQIGLDAISSLRGDNVSVE